VQPCQLSAANHWGMAWSRSPGPNMYPKSLDVAPKIAGLCVPLIDTIPTCTARWVQLPPALELIDQVFKKLNSTIENAVKPFAIGSNGRFVYVDTYTKMRDHCMKMEVEIKTRLSIPRKRVRSTSTTHQRSISAARIPGSRPVMTGLPSPSISIPLRSASSSTATRRHRAWACTRTIRATPASAI